MPKPRSIFLLGQDTFHQIYDAATRSEIQRITNNDGTLHTEHTILSASDAYADVEIIFGGWGTPTMNQKVVDALPGLKALFYGAGSVSGIVTDAFWERNILITSAYRMNAIPVAEYTQACIILSLKHAWASNRALRNGVCNFSHGSVPGVYTGSTVGVISLGAIGQLVCNKLAALEVDVVAYDPFVSEATFETCHARPMPSLEALFETCDVITLHTPWLKETEGMINGDLLRRMPCGASFLNTSRGAVVNETELHEVLKERPDLFAVLDVITDESAYTRTPLRELPNVFLTPHIAGSAGRECHRMGRSALDECRRYLQGDAPGVPILREKSLIMA